MSIASPIISVSNLTGNTKSERYVQAINDFLQGILQNNCIQIRISNIFMI